MCEQPRTKKEYALVEAPQNNYPASPLLVGRDQPAAVPYLCGCRLAGAMRGLPLASPTRLYSPAGHGSASGTTQMACNGGVRHDSDGAERDVDSTVPPQAPQASWAVGRGRKPAAGATTRRSTKPCPVSVVVFVVNQKSQKRSIAQSTELIRGRAAQAGTDPCRVEQKVTNGHPRFHFPRGGPLVGSRNQNSIGEMDSFEAVSFHALETPAASSSPRLPTGRGGRPSAPHHSCCDAHAVSPAVGAWLLLQAATTRAGLPPTLCI